jgi:CMP-N-acetylneuraminic acid synthetase
MEYLVMNSIAIILARGGSKRLPGKNQRLFFGKPLVAWTVEAAINSKCFNRILLSTDSKDIAQIGIDYGAEVPFLRDRAFDDHSSSSQATLAALSQAESHWSESYETVTQLMGNCPLRTGDDICNAMNSFTQAGASSQISSFKFGWMNPWWAARLTPEGSPDWIFPEFQGSRSQDLPELFCPSGAIWISKSKTLRTHQTFYSPGHVFSVMDWVSALDIDDEADWMMAEACMLLQQKSNQNI